jgi:soluble cytochrome b562
MVQYTLAQNPDVLLTVPGKDSAKARDKAMEQLIELMDAGKLPTDLSDGFSPQQFIEVKEKAVKENAVKEKAVKENAVKENATPAVDTSEDAISQAVQTLSNLATLKLKVQASRAEAMQIRSQVDTLFTDEAIDEAETAKLKEGFKVLKAFAQANLRYQEARAQAEHARTVLDEVLHSNSTGTSAPARNGKSAS